MRNARVLQCRRYPCFEATSAYGRVRSACVPHAGCAHPCHPLPLPLVCHRPCEVSTVMAACSDYTAVSSSTTSRPYLPRPYSSTHTTSLSSSTWQHGCGMTALVEANDCKATYYVSIFGTRRPATVRWCSRSTAIPSYGVRCIVWLQLRSPVGGSFHPRVAIL